MEPSQTDEILVWETPNVSNVVSDLTNGPKPQHWVFIQPGLGSLSLTDIRSLATALCWMADSVSFVRTMLPMELIDSLLHNLTRENTDNDQQHSTEPFNINRQNSGPSSPSLRSIRFDLCPSSQGTATPRFLKALQNNDLHDGLTNFMIRSRDPGLNKGPMLSVLQHNTTLKSVTLSCGEMGPELAEALRHNRTLQRLTIKGTLTDEGLYALIDTLRNNPDNNPNNRGGDQQYEQDESRLTHLTLPSRSTYPSDALDALCDVIRYDNHTLCDVNILNNFRPGTMDYYFDRNRVWEGMQKLVRSDAIDVRVWVHLLARNEQTKWCDFPYDHIFWMIQQRPHIFQMNGGDYGQSRFGYSAMPLPSHTSGPLEVLSAPKSNQEWTRTFLRGTRTEAFLQFGFPRFVIDRVLDHQDNEQQQLQQEADLGDATPLPVRNIPPEQDFTTIRLLLKTFEEYTLPSHTHGGQRWFCTNQEGEKEDDNGDVQAHQGLGLSPEERSEEAEALRAIYDDLFKVCDYVDENGHSHQRYHLQTSPDSELHVLWHDDNNINNNNESVKENDSRPSRSSYATPVFFFRSNAYTHYQLGQINAAIPKLLANRQGEAVVFDVVDFVTNEIPSMLEEKGYIG